jgi:hypothetical protein
MPTFPTLPRIDLSDLDFSKLEWPKIEWPKFDLPEFDLSKFELPKFDLPTVDLPDFELPTVEQIAGFARDAAYVGIGLAVMTAERLQALQQQFVELVTTQLAKVREAV